MDKKQNELLIKMVLKINEAKTYNKISIVLTVLWFIEFIYTFFVTQNFNLMYWLIWVLSVVGWFHMSRKFKKSMEEYEQLKQEYENTI